MILRFAFVGWLACALARAAAAASPLPMEHQLTSAPRHHDLDNNDNFTADGRWLVFDTREDDTGIGGNAVIARVDVSSGRVEELYRDPAQRAWGPGVGAASANPRDGRVVFIRGLSSASAELPYAMWRRTGAYVQPGAAGALHFLDARNVVAPFTPGALRGGTHRHEWSADGQWIGFTYNDALLADLEQKTGELVNLRTVGVAQQVAGGVHVPAGPQNHDGEFFTVVAVEVVPKPKPGSDEVSKAFEDGWVGHDGYLRADGTRQRHARAFLGTIRTSANVELTEVFIVDLPENLTRAGTKGPLEGTATTMPAPPAGAAQRRLTHTEQRRHPGVALLPRHWVRSSADGTRIVFLAKDDAGIEQAYFVSPNGGALVQATHEVTPIQSAVRWSPDGNSLLYVADNTLKRSDARVNAKTFGTADALTARSAEMPEAPVWSPDGRLVAFNRRVMTQGVMRKQIFIVTP